MTIDAVLTARSLNGRPMLYKINLESKDSDLEELYEIISNTTDPILSLDTIKNNFDINNYKVHIHTHNKLIPLVDDIPDSVKEIYERINKRLGLLDGKQYIELNKNDIKEMFSVEIWRNKQLNKLIMMDQYAVYEKEPRHGKDINGVMMAPFSTKEEAELVRVKYGYNDDNYYVDKLK